MRTAALLWTLLVLTAGSVRGQGYNPYSPPIPPPPPDLLPVQAASSASAAPAPPAPPPGDASPAATTSAPQAPEIPPAAANLLPPPALYTPPVYSQTPNSTPPAPGSMPGAAGSAGDALPSPTRLPSLPSAAPDPLMVKPPPGAPVGSVLGVVPPKWVWGEVDAKAFPDAGRIAPNGVAYGPLFSMDLNFNIWLWREQRIYGFGLSRYWGGRGGQGQTHGNFDYTRREYDLDAGFAWNYYQWLELRAVGYGHENFNRGTSEVSPGGNTNDGAGLEQRLYLSSMYDLLGQHGFNISRAPYVSVGYYGTKSLIGGDGKQYNPGAFLRAYLIYEIPSTTWYLFGDFYQVFSKSGTARMLYSDVGLAIPPCRDLPQLEIRLGSEFNTDFNASGSVRNMSLPYVSLRFNY